MINMHRNEISNGFIGMYLNNQDELSWTDQTVADYFSWSKGEPNNYFGLEGCATMFSGSGHWNDVYCSRPANGYVCKRTADGQSPSTPKPTQMPEGHCPPDHYEFQGYCYKFIGMLAGSSSDDYKNWTEARNDCKNLGLDYDLVSIHSDKEQAFLTSVLAENDVLEMGQVYEFWIGFLDFVHW